MKFRVFNFTYNILLFHPDIKIYQITLSQSAKVLYYNTITNKYISQKTFSPATHVIEKVSDLVISQYANTILSHHSTYSSNPFSFFKPINPMNQRTSSIIDQPIIAHESTDIVNGHHRPLTTPSSASIRECDNPNINPGVGYRYILPRVNAGGGTKSIL